MAKENEIKGLNYSELRWKMNKKRMKAQMSTQLLS